MINLVKSTRSTLDEDFAMQILSNADLTGVHGVSCFRPRNIEGLRAWVNANAHGADRERLTRLLDALDADPTLRLLFDWRPLRIRGGEEVR